MNQMDLWKKENFKYIKLDVLDFAAVVELDDFRNHYEEVCDEFFRARCDYLYTRRAGKHYLVHVSLVEYATSILTEGIRPSDEECDVGACVYAYDYRTPAADVFDFQQSASRRIGYLFEWDGEMFQCVHSKDTYAPLRYCVVKEHVPADKIIRCSLEIDDLLSAQTALDFLRRMGYPEYFLEKCKCGSDPKTIVNDCAVLNGNRDIPK